VFSARQERNLRGVFYAPGNWGVIFHTEGVLAQYQRNTVCLGKTSWRIFSDLARKERMVPLVQRVIQQTRARVFRGDTRFEGKIVSVFEPSAEVIRKGKSGKPNEFGDGQAARSRKIRSSSTMKSTLTAPTTPTC
jgi:hypothetical protein